MSKTALSFALLSGFLFSAAAAQAGEADEKAAVSAAESWLKLADKGDYDKTWQEASKLFRDAVTSKAWAQAAGSARGPLGKLVSRKLKSATPAKSLPGAPDGNYVVIQFESVFENKSTAIETITPMLEKDGRWRVSGYYIK